MLHPFKVFLRDSEMSPRAFSVLNNLSLDTVYGFLSGKCRKIPTGVKSYDFWVCTVNGRESREK